MSQLRSVFTTPRSQPLIGIPFEENGQEVIRYFSEEALRNDALSSENVEQVLELAGAWEKLSWKDMASSLDRIRHQSPPTPPVDL